MCVFYSSVVAVSPECILVAFHCVCIRVNRSALTKLDVFVAPKWVQVVFKRTLILLQ